jgi:hypothetical protein
MSGSMRFHQSSKFVPVNQRFKSTSLQRRVEPFGEHGVLTREMKTLGSRFRATQHGRR